MNTFKKFFLGFTTLLLVVLLTTIMMPSVYAAETDFVTVTTVESGAGGAIQWHLRDSGDKVHIDDGDFTGGTLLENDKYLSKQAWFDDYNGEGYVYRIQTLYPQFTIKSGSTVVYTTSSINGYIEIEGDQYYGGGVYFRNGSTLVYTWNGSTDLEIFVHGTVDLAPAIDGQQTFVTSVADARPLSFFQDYITAFDETDGDLTDEIYVVSDNYTPNKLVLGTYQVTFGVEDANGNESTLTINITVADITKPVITGNSTKAIISYTQTWNISTFKSTLTVSDNYDTLVNSDIIVKTDEYTSNKTNLGTYNVVYSVTDDSGNEATFTKQVEVIDDVAPVFSGPTTISKPTNSILTVTDIKGQLSATDVKEGVKTSQIVVKTDNYTGHGNQVGSYTIVFEVSDSKGNKSIHTVTVNVIDDVAPIWFITDGVSVVLESPASITRQQIIDLLVATGQISVQGTSQVNFVIDEYTGNEDVAGVYVVSIEFSDALGNESVHNMAITVLESEDDPIVVNPDAPWYQFAIDSWDWIKTHPWESVLIGLGTLLVLGIGLAIISGNKKKNNYYHK